MRLDINSMCIVINQFIVTSLFVSRSYGKKSLPFYRSDSVLRVCNVDFINFSGSKAHMEMERIIRGRLLVTDVKKLSPVQQTSELEAFHKLVCHFAPKLVHFFYAQMEARYFTTYYHYLQPFQFSLYRYIVSLCSSFMCTGSSGGRVVKLLTCGARGPRFDSRPHHLNFQRLVTSCFKVEIWLKYC